MSRIGKYVLEMRLIFAFLLLVSLDCFAQSGVVYKATFDQNVTDGVSQTLLGPQNNYLFFGQHTWICQSVTNSLTPVLVQYGGNPNNVFVNSQCPGFEGVIGVENAIVSSNNGTDTFNDARFFYVSSFATMAPVAFFVTATATATATASGFTNCTASGDILSSPVNFEVSGGNPLGPQMRLTQPVGSVTIHCDSPMSRANTKCREKLSRRHSVYGDLNCCNADGERNDLRE